MLGRSRYGQDGSGASGQRGETVGRVDPSGAAIGEPEPMATAFAAAGSASDSGGAAAGEVAGGAMGILRALVPTSATSNTTM